MTRIYIPPIVFPVSSIIAGLVDFVFPFLLLIAFLAYYQVAPTWNIIFFPVAFILLLALYSATQLFMSVLAVRFKDVGMMVPILSQLFFFGTPIFYPLSNVPEQYAAFFAINPMVGIVELFRWSILGLPEFPDHLVLYVSFSVILLFAFLTVIMFGRFSRNLSNYLD